MNRYFVKVFLRLFSLANLSCKTAIFDHIFLSSRTGRPGKGPARDSFVLRLANHRSQHSKVVRLVKPSIMNSTQKAATLIFIEGIPTTDSLKAALQHMGEQFLLSSREVDAPALYATGYTQKKVAEGLFITPATVRIHIKRISSTCGLYSRQEILEHLAAYGS